MGPLLLFFTLAQLPAAASTDAGVERPHLAVGAEFGGGIAGPFEGTGMILGAGLRGTIPLGGRHSLNLRVMHAVPGLDGGIYEIRWQRQVDWRGPIKPDYAGVGAVGFYWMKTGLYGRVLPQLGGVTRPMMMSLTAGWNNPVSSRLVAPIELSILAHPYGLLAASVGVGLTWTEAGATRRNP